ncbi:MAG TPA: hypothetical protein VIZ65_17240 [Cellvibrionaceae bacterium]
MSADASLSMGAYRIEAGPSQVEFDAGERLRHWLEDTQPKPELAPELKNYAPDETQQELSARVPFEDTEQLPIQNAPQAAVSELADKADV